MENILSVEKIFSPGNSIQIIFSEYIGNIKKFSATVTAFQDEGLYVATKEKELANLLEQGSEITIEYENEDGKKYFFGAYKIAHVSQEGPILILAKPWKANQKLLRRYFDNNVVLPWKVNVASLRRYFRVNVELPFYLLDGNVHIGQIIDLSVGGLFVVLNPDAQFLLGSHLDFQLKLPDGKPLQLQGEIVRTEIVENNKLGVGINFLNLSEEAREEITQYLLNNSRIKINTDF